VVEIREMGSKEAGMVLRNNHRQMAIRNLSSFYMFFPHLYA